MWGALSDERTGLSFTIAAGPAITVILGSESHGTRDHILLPQIRDFPQSQSYIATDERSISKSWCRAPSGAHDQIFIIV
jgi:hypothetical protein